MKTRAGEIILHLLRIGGITVLFVFLTFYPLLPGEYDGLAMALSAMAQAFGLVGLLLVPIGALWLAYEIRKQARSRRNLPVEARRYYFAIGSFISGLIVAFAASVSALATNIGFAFSLGTVALWVYTVSRILPRLKRLKNCEPEKFSFVPLYLILAPIVTLLCHISFAAAATEFGRSRAIAASAVLINDIEKYHAERGQYPRSLSGLWADYKPSVIGIKEFHYVPNGGAYNLFFEQPMILLSALGTREIVMYNKLDEHIMISHAAWNFRRSLEEFGGRQGWYAVHDASSPHWKYFWFD